jgi:hypothetical protein
LTFAAKSHAAACNITEATAIGTFNGQFWGVFASNQVVGNLISLALLQFEKVGAHQHHLAQAFSWQISSSWGAYLTIFTCYCH